MINILTLALTLFVGLLSRAKAAEDLGSFDIQANFINQNYMTELFVKFQPSNYVTQFDAFRLEFPSTFNIGFDEEDYAFAGYWISKTDTCESEVYDESQTLEAIEKDGVVRIVQYKDGVREPYYADLIYIFRIISPSVVTAAPGIYSPILAYLTPTNGVVLDPEIFSFDRSHFFSSLQVADEPIYDAMTVEIETENTVDFGSISEIHTVSYAIQTSIDYEGSIRLQLEYNNLNIKFVEDSCTLTQEYTNKTFEFVYHEAQLEIFIFSVEWKTTDSLEFDCDMKNSPFEETDSLIVKVMRTAVNHVLEDTELVDPMITINGIEWDEDSLYVNMAWNFSTVNTAGIPAPMKFYHSGTTPIYNTIWFYFSNGETVIENDLSKLQLTLMNDANFQILETSITTNVPASTGTFPQCSVDGSNNIICEQIGPFTCNTTCPYYVAFRFRALDSLTFPADFGEIQLVDDEDRIIVNTGLAEVPAGLTSTVANLDLYDSIIDPTDSDFRANQQVHTLITGDEPAATNEIFGLKQTPSTEDDGVDIVFEHKWLDTWVSAVAIESDDGVEYYTTPQIAPVSLPPTCTPHGTATSWTCEIRSESIADEQQFTLFRFASDSNQADQFPAATAVTALKFNSVSVNAFSGVKIIDDAIFDVYGRGVQDNLVTGRSISSILTDASTQDFMINGYALSSFSYENLNISMSAVWLTATDGNEGLLFPTTITIKGQFSISEADTIKIISVFFTQLEPFDYTGNYSCGITTDQPINCTYYSPGSYEFSPLSSARIDIDMTDALTYATRNEFNLAFPVKTVLNQNNIWLGIGVSRSDLVDNTFEPSYLQWENFLHFEVGDFSGTLMSDDHHVDLSIPIGVRFGEVDISSISEINVQFDLEGTSVTNSGAGLILCSHYTDSFESEDFRAIMPNEGVGYDVKPAKYYYTNPNDILTYCGHVAFSDDFDITTKDVRLFSITYPRNPHTDDDFMITFSSNNSEVHSIQTDNLSSKLKINFDLQILDFSSDPIQLSYPSIQNKVIINFLPGSQLPILPTFLVEFNTFTEYTINHEDQTNQCYYIFRDVEYECDMDQEDVYLEITNIDDSLIGTQEEIELHLDGIDFTAAGSDNITTTFSVRVLSDGTVVQENWEFSNGTFELIPNESPHSPLHEIIIDSIDVNQPVQNAVSRLEINFTVDKSLNQALCSFEITLPLSATLIDSRITCTAYSGEELSRMIIDCKFKSATVLEVNGHGLPTIATEYQYSITIDHVRMPDSNGLTDFGDVEISQFVGTTELAYGSTTMEIDIEEAEEGITDFVFEKRYNTPGETLEILISFPAPFVLDYSTEFILHFPHYYPVYLNEDTITCYVSNIVRPCLVEKERSIYIKGSLLTLLEEDEFELVIYGVTQPQYDEMTDFTFLVGNRELADPEDEFSGVLDVLRTVTITDTLPSAIPEIFEVLNATSSSEAARTLSKYTIWFNLDITVATAYEILNIVFPNGYKNDIFQGDSSFQCQLILHEGDSKTLYLPTCTRVGSRIKITLREDVPLNKLYQLIIIDVLNPKSQVCHSDRIRIGWSPDDGSEITAMTPPTGLNMPLYNYTEELEAVKAVGVTILESPFYKFNKFGYPLITPGAFTLPVEIKSKPGQYFQGETVFFFNQLYFSGVNGINQQRTIEVLQGYDKAVSLVGCSGTTISSIFEVKVWKAELEGSFYSEIPRFIVDAFDSPIVLDIPEIITIPQGGISLPLIFNLANRIPFEFVTFAANIQSPASSFVTVETRTMVTCTRTEYLAYLQFGASIIAELGASYNISIDIGGVNSKSYALPRPNITVQFVQMDSDKPQLKIVKPEQINGTSQLFRVLGSHTGQFYYSISLNQTSEFTCQEIVERANAPHDYFYNKLDPKQIQYGQFSLEKENSIFLGYNEHLMTRSVYAIFGCMQSQMGVWSDLTRQSFKTVDNNVTVVRTKFTFDGNLTDEQLEDFLCFTSRYFQMPKQSVISGLGTFCDYGEKRYLEFGALLRPNFTDSSLTEEDENMAVQELIFYGSREMEAYDPRTDYAEGNLSTFNETTNKFKKAFLNWQENVTSSGFPDILRVEVLGEIIDATPILSGNLTANIGTHYIHVENLTMDSVGTLVVLLTENFIPTFYQAMFGDGSIYESPILFNDTNRYIFKLQPQETVEFNFTDLEPNTTYSIVMYTRNLDPTFLTTISEPLILSLETEFLQIEEVLSGVRIGFGLVILFMIMILF